MPGRDAGTWRRRSSFKLGSMMRRLRFSFVICRQLMKQSYTIWFGMGLLLAGAFISPVRSAEGRNEIDWNRARELFQKSQRGESLTAAEQEYLARAKRLRSGQVGRPGVAGSEPRTNQHFTPLTELATNRYKGAEGGLYGGRRNP